ncbi:MAG: DUF4345 family protein [Pseudomonadota bacterium]
MKPSARKLTARLLLGLVALFLLMNGLRIMFDPSGALAGMLVDANSAEGLSNVRALWGGAITAIGISVVIAAVTGKIENARPAVLFSFMLVVARIVGIIVDGSFDRAIVFTVVPIVVFLLLLTAHKLLDKSEEAQA